MDGTGSPWELPHIAELIQDGEITVGVVRPVGCVAVASDADTTLAMLVRRKGETLTQLLSPPRPGHRQGLRRRDLYRRDQFLSR